ncbi:hypothetical protein HBHAL_2891 [Halobacillus halophilus DSM 2266]|uniref:Uncharacterized protein n=1 Tax=Halobacillus halophilus (strain ATCC 35676 / DSM 2266 / JCM 20832 / KCTC 3685 / LMG 17431 / NBRC 102448 / NCIMB 2269) TaxID=866895 RepID=I0JM69_HALH3|nr:hypothetical protein HBHAL_2891 [Halobacillus halophilus DSM 2266]
MVRFTVPFLPHLEVEMPPPQETASAHPLFIHAM